MPTVLDPSVERDPVVTIEEDTSDPVRFAELKLGITCWSKMREIMEAVASGKRKILIRSCNGAGKTTAVAAVCNWKLLHYPDSIVLTTASSWMQVERTLWGEIRKQARHGNIFEAATITSTSIRITDKHYALGISPGIPENAQGFHAPSMLIAIDEATGVSREIFDALSGNATSADTQMLMICNPINMQSYPYEAELSGDWHLITISAMEHPNVVEGREVIPGAVTRTWIEDRLRAWSYEVSESSQDALYVPWLAKWFKRTPIVASRILGEWSDTEAEGFLAMELIERSLTAEPERGMRAIGIDISRSSDGDATIFAFFDGGRQLDFLEFQHSNTMEIALKAKDLYDAGWLTIAIDDTGIGGGVSDRLKELKVPHHAVNFSERPRGFLQHRKDLLNARAEMYFTLEEDLRLQRIRLVNDRRFHQELAATRLAVSERATGYRMEDKANVRRRLGRSPDKADATALARYAVRLEEAKRKPLLY